MPAPAQTHVSVEGFLGAAASASSELTVSRAGRDRSFAADWASRPFDQPIYWGLRAGARRGSFGIELQLLHHKLYLGNAQEGISSFEITHGFNLLTLQAARRGGPVDLRAGAGVVLPHVTAVVDDAEFASDGYRVGGPALMLGAGRAVPISGRLFLQFELQGSIARCAVDVSDGRVQTWNYALHGLVGIGTLF